MNHITLVNATNKNNATGSQAMMKLNKKQITALKSLDKSQDELVATGYCGWDLDARTGTSLRRHGLVIAISRSTPGAGFRYILNAAGRAALANLSR